MDDMKHDVMMMHKRKRTYNSIMGATLGRYKDGACRLEKNAQGQGFCSIG
jgi:hypothetical protein